MKVALVSLEERAIEWFSALCLIWVGICFLMPGDALALERFAALKRYGATDSGLGYIAVSSGVFRLVALFVNGRKASTPYYRVLFAVVGFLFWTPLASASFESAAGHPLGFMAGITAVGAGGGMYFLMANFEVFSVYRAMSDSRYQTTEYGGANAIE